VVGDCDNCLSPGEELAPVHRLYLLPAPSRLEELEWWCVACRTQYPHEDAPPPG